MFLFVRLFDRKAKSFGFHGAVVTTWRLGGSMGLGMFIFYGAGERPEKERILVHEWGHTIQSLILGPLYLPVIGLPSVIWATAPRCIRYRKRTGKRYTDLYCEKWASATGQKLTQKEAIWT